MPLENEKTAADVKAESSNGDQLRADPLKSKTLRERIEDNIAVWLLGTLLAGFLAGIATYRSVQEIGGLQIVTTVHEEELKGKLSDAESQINVLTGQVGEYKSQLLGLQNAMNKKPVKPDQHASHLQVQPTAGYPATPTVVPAAHTPTPSPSDLQSDPVRQEPSPNQDKYTALRGLTIVIVHSDGLVSKASALQVKLENIGMNVRLKLDNSGRGGPPINYLYGKASNDAAAAILLGILKDYGIRDKGHFPNQEAVQTDFATTLSP